jgi:hypothetical protein
MPESTEQQQIEKLDQILRILAVIATKGLKQRDQIAILDKAGLAPKHIAELLRTTSNTIRVELVALRRADRTGTGRNVRPSSRSAKGPNGR